MQSAVVAPSVSGSLDTTIQQVGRAAGNQLMEALRDGDVIAITGGKAVSAVVENLQPERGFDVTVVPLTGGVQGKYYTDVNHLASRLAEKLGGRAILLHAPLFAESREQRDMLRDMASTRAVFDLARAGGDRARWRRLDPDAGLELFRPASDAQSRSRTGRPQRRGGRIPRPSHP